MSTSPIPRNVIGNLSRSKTARIGALTEKPWRALGSALMAIVLVALYYQILWKLAVDWWEIPDYSHGFLVPPFAAYLVWIRRQELQKIEIAPTWNGIGVVVGGLAMLILGVLGAELFLSRVSLLIVLAGLTLTLGGRHLLRALRFVFLVLLLAIPLPAIIFNQITLPLQTLSAKSASALLPLFGVPVLREGNVIALPMMKLEVAQACSGIRSLVSLLTVAIVFGYFLEQSVPRRILLAAASIPIAIIANCLRIIGTGLSVQYWGPDKAVGFFHDFSGWIMFLVSLACLYAVHLTFSLWPKAIKT